MTDLTFLDPNPSGRPVVLLLHGLGADGVSWTLQLPALAQAGFRPLAPDAPGFGRSPYDGRGWSIPRTASVMADLLQDLGTGPAHLVGLSMGGTIAQQLTLDYPYLVQKLVLVSTYGVLRPERLSGWLYFLQRFMLVNLLGLPAQARFVAQHIFPDPQHEPLREMLITSIIRADPRAYRAAMRSLGLFNSQRRLREIKAKTLVITGLKDTTVPPTCQRSLTAGITGAQQVTIPDAGHAIPVDQPEIFNRVLIAFLHST